MQFESFHWLSHHGILRIPACLACVYRVMDARGKFGELTTTSSHDAR